MTGFSPTEAMEDILLMIDPRTMTGTPSLCKFVPAGMSIAFG